VGLTLADVRRHGRRILVGTHTGIPFDTAGQWDILLLPYGEEATGERAGRMAGHMEFARVYACVCPRRRADPNIRINLEMIAGPVISALPKPGAAVTVIMVPVLSSATVAAGNSPLERKRTLYWHNADRNETIAALAQNIGKGEWSALRRYGIRKCDIVAVAPERPRGIAVLVESTEHATELMSLLSGWTLQALTPSTPGEVENNNAISPRRIVTTSYAARHGIDANIIIRATGTESPLRVRQFRATDNRQGSREVLVIDVADSVDNRAEQETRRRQEYYLKSGMTVVRAQSANQDHDEVSESNSPQARRTDATRGGAGPRTGPAVGNNNPAPSRSVRRRK
jgi:hypothetical protein